ncbi:MAG: aldehyde dehydrogenase family protein [Deltaproteobacteria bacterium]|nr:aldehyde dehydrogenase family protein [Deltaproteobacteria bacterium]
MAANLLVPNLDPRALARELSNLHLIDGRLVAPVSGKGFDVRNPATMEAFAQAAEGDAQDVDAAVQAAAKAQKDWARLPARQRGRMLAEAARLLEAHKEELARLVCLETGKAIRTECRGETAIHIDTYMFFAGLASELKGETIPYSPDVLAMTVREPLGVVGAIIPWNVPMGLMALKVAPALVAGNAVVVKSAEEAPFCCLRTCQIMNQVLPPGVFNILSGMGPECGAPLAAHPLVKKVTFTGSVAAGKSVALAAAKKLIPVTLELGGKSPMIILEDADLDRAVEGAVVSMRFTRQGQSCSAASRMLVHRSLHDEFVKRLKAKVDQFVMGDPFDEATDIGSIVSPGQYETVQKYLKIGDATPGAVGHRCSQVPTAPHLKNGLFVQPVLFTGLPRDSAVVCEEIFGPVTTILPFDDFDEAIDLANATEYGLAATIWTNDLKRALTGMQRLEAGFVQVNQNLIVQAQLSYGGIKASGMGREASLESMIEHFTHSKTILVNLK